MTPFGQTVLLSVFILCGGFEDILYIKKNTGPIHPDIMFILLDIYKWVFLTTIVFVKNIKIYKWDLFSFVQSRLLRQHHIQSGHGKRPGRRSAAEELHEL